MKLVILCTATQQNELQATGETSGGDATYIKALEEMLHFPATDVFIDLLFENEPARLQWLQRLPCTVIVHSVSATLQEMKADFVRVNAWPGFLRTSLVEASANNAAAKNKAEAAFQLFNKTVEWLPDEPGFVTPRVVSMIINEAYFARAEGISTKEEIDVAMKLGTHYPYGPFEWSEKIGLKNVVHLLTTLSATDKRYTPAPLLLKECGK